MAGLAQFQGGQGLPDGVEAGVGDPAQYQVLLLGGADFAAGVLAHEGRQAAQLRPGQVAAHGFDIGHIVAGLPLRRYIGLYPPPEIGVGGAGGVGSGRRQRGRIFALDGVGGHQGAEVDGADLRQFGVHHTAEFVQADFVNQHLEAGHHPVFAEDVGVVEHRPDRLGDAQVVVRADPFVEGLGEAGHNGSAAAAIDLEPLALFPINLLILGDESQILDGRRHFVLLVVAGEGRLELAGEVLGEGMADAEPDIGGEVGRGVKHFVRADAGGGGADHIADGVAASLAGGEADCAQQSQRGRGLLQGDVVELDVFAGGDMALAEGGVLFADFGQGVQHIGRGDAAGQFDADHLHVGLALAVHALAQAERRKGGIVQCAAAKAVNFGVKTPDFILHKGDDAGRMGRQLHTGFVDFAGAGVGRRGGGGQGDPSCPAMRTNGLVRRRVRDDGDSDGDGGGRGSGGDLG